MTKEFTGDGSMMGLDIAMTVLQPSLEYALHRIRVIARQGGASDEVREMYEAEARRLWHLAWPKEKARPVREDQAGEGAT